MDEFWEWKFKDEQTSWGFEPCDSASIASELFQKEKIKKILIPGIGYGRNAGPFLKQGCDVSGIEISHTAIDLAKKNGLNFPIHHGSVLDMPFDNSVYEGIFGYAMIHLLNKNERIKFLKDCYNQLAIGGFMIFTVVSKKSEMYGNGKLISKDRYELAKGLTVFFYDNDSVQKEFENFGLFECQEMEEPIKHMKDVSPLKCFLVKCKKLK